MAWNDPQWGNNGNRNKNSGPPDLDEIWRRINQRLNGLFGKKDTGGGSGGGGGFSPEGLPGGGNLVGVLIGVLVLVWVASGFYIVDTGQRGVVLRFGQYIETTEPGPRWHLPWPVESREIVNVDQVRTVEVGYRSDVKSKVLRESLMLTDDENIIDLQFAVQYILKDPKDFLFVNRGPEETVLQVAETAMREIVGKNKMDFVLYEGRAEIAASAKVLLQQILDRYNTGISISQVTLQNIQPPEQVQAAFDDAVKAGQDRERLKNEAEAYFNDIVPRARGVASRLTEEAEGYKLSVTANAEGEASRFAQIFTEYQKAPQVTRQRMYLDTMQAVMNNTSKILVDQKGGNSLLYLPLDKLQQTVSQPYSGGPDVLSQSAPAPAATPLDARTRDALRNRDREARP
ncbi:MAG: FtsH protease activity modulator HflK [Thiobacillus sp.]|nr:FtsH protease activity modulator HflK [Thiobacillus sp.]MDP2253827.1 FtsH protease activity modulator HflK [Thiobacillus sp.]MDP2979292.1 FtsH protease activity modulator HflK [Thiobacillus sp.]